MATILAVDTSAKSVSCAIAKDGRIVGSYFINNGYTHSQTLMPMIENLLKVSDIALDEVDAFAINAGPGSFTGVRIGVAAVKGLAFTANKPCVSVSTLQSMAENLPLMPEYVICGVMDARCQQVYTAMFTQSAEGDLCRLSEDAALSITELGEALAQLFKPVMLVGDGCELCYQALKDSVPQLYLAPPAVRFQSAAGTALTAERLFSQGVSITADKLLPVYLRLPQAERELNSRLNQ